MACRRPSDWQTDAQPDIHSKRSNSLHFRMHKRVPSQPKHREFILPAHLYPRENTRAVFRSLPCGTECRGFNPRLPPQISRTANHLIECVSAGVAARGRPLRKLARLSSARENPGRTLTESAPSPFRLNQHN